ncbi:CRISPR-associated endoribonuclease Cas6 [Clostridium sp. DSM 8431]|uniref:CRISPR-associated endoribonuclease Cas6 n=1 Tax=Clostridium sp. DSM 8431 TaxID=1761781 RepID=UPI0008F2CD50|nr:CRISPR-associated endoribonuclease Cas6 [Clostridium sp. DSM 8431]SFU78049.1 CRISPR-associated endoribonuclease Cas6 [Clostridium sp. DSM 8431]
MRVYEIKIKLFLMKDIKLSETQTSIASFIDKAFGINEELIEFHKRNCFKNYCFDLLYPIEKDKLYKNNKAYTLRIRTINRNLADFFSNKLVNCYDNNFKALVGEIKIIPKKPIEKLYSITPVILKNDSGYWKKSISFEDFERRLKENLIKKYNAAFDTKIEEDFDLYTGIEFLNNKPISIQYKNIKLLGDKLSLKIADDKRAQNLAYMALGCSLGENGSRGAGFVNCKWY